MYLKDLAFKNWRVEMTIIKSENKPLSVFKKRLFITLATAALTLSACDRKDDSTMEGSALELDSQTSEQEAAAEIAAANPMDSTIESAILPSEDMPEDTGTISGDGAGQGDVATADVGTKGGMYTDSSATDDTLSDSDKL